MDTMQTYYEELRQVLGEFPSPGLEAAVEVLWSAWKNRKQVILLGNGGSAATASHITCDLRKGTAVPGKQRLRVQALTENVAVLTALANDIDYDSVFKDQLIDVIDEGDVVIAISASGNSPNVIEAVQHAQSVGAVIVGFCGFSGGRLKELSSACVWVKSHNYGIVEDAHLTFGHAISQELRRRIERTN